MTDSVGVSANTLDLKFDGSILQRGFWLYIWEIKPMCGKTAYYVGRTGDSSSPYAQSPFNRMGQHLGNNHNNNVLRRQLTRRGIVPEQCQFRLIAHGPIEPEASREDLLEHNNRRDRVAALERELARAMVQAGYNLINRVDCRKTSDADDFADIRRAFSAAFPELAPS